MNEPLYEVPKLWREDTTQEAIRYPVSVRQALTMRDQFAMAALTGLLANTNYDWPWDKCAERAYVAAHYMLEARKEKK